MEFVRRIFREMTPPSPLFPDGRPFIPFTIDEQRETCLVRLAELGLVHRLPGEKERIRLLDGPVRYRFRKDGELLGAWSSVSNIPGPSRAKVVPPPAVDGAVPPSSSGAAPAA